MTTHPFTYESAIAYIHGAYGQGAKDGLNNMRLLLERLGNPQDRFPSIHVAGTNGKGSVCAFLHAALTCSGYRTGLYTSPFLQRYNERMRVGGVPIADDALARLVERVAAEVDALRQVGVRPTEFEIGTALAFLYFAEEQVDIAVVEVGLGGRLDPTNVITPLVSVIASIGLDHMRVLGHTPEAIAREKAGIAKRGVPLVLSAQASEGVREVILETCRAKGAPLYLAKPAVGLALGLAGAHQAYNAGTAWEALSQLRRAGWNMPDASILEGFRRVRWPGRLEWVDVSPPLLLDGAHNPQGVQMLVEYLQGLPRARTVLLCGIMADKDWQDMARILAGVSDEAVAVAPDNKRSLDAAVLAHTLGSFGVFARAADTLSDAYQAAQSLAGPQGRIVAAGSLYLIGELRTLAVGPDSALLAPEESES